MKKINFQHIIVINFIILLTSCSTFKNVSKQQKDTFEGIIQYDIIYLDNDLPTEAIDQLASEATLYKRGKMLKSESYSQIMATTVIKNANDKTMHRLINVMGQKFLIEETISEDSSKDIQIIHTNNHKLIDGYTCNEVIIQYPNQVDTLYYSPLIGDKSFNFDIPIFKNINGIPLEYVLHTPELSIKMKATKITKERIPRKSFTIPADYKKITKEELKDIFVE